MACLDMYNSEHKSHHDHHCPTMSPRISFSNDFVEAHQIIKQERNSREAPPVSSDFEFSVSNYSMMSADELFLKGKLLQFKDNGSNIKMQKTLREELLVGDDDDDDDNVTLRPPKGSTRWMGFLGLKRNQIDSKKVDKNEGSRSAVVHEDTHVSKTSQEFLTEGGSSCRNVDIGI